jgi:hypothetical protein
MEPVVKALSAIDAPQEVLSRVVESDLVREQGVYVSTLESPLIVQTPVVTLVSDIGGEGNGDEELSPFATLKVRGCTAQQLKAVEDAVAELAVTRKKQWFREDISDETIRAGVKRFVDVEQKNVRVRVADAITVFDASRKKTEDIPSRGTRVKAVLELSRITFSKTQFGVVWKLKQLKLAADSTCLFEEDDEEKERVAKLADNMDETILAVVDEDLSSSI